MRGCTSRATSRSTSSCSRCASSSPPGGSPARDRPRAAAACCGCRATDRPSSRADHGGGDRVPSVAMSNPPAPQAPGYGASINLETARKVATAAAAEGRKNGWTVAVAIVDTAGDLVYFERMDDTQVASSHVAQEK